MLMVVAIVLNNSLRSYGARSDYGSEIPLAVNGIIVKICAVLGAFTVGIAQGCQPIFGFNMGAKNYGRLKETYIKALAVSLCVCVIAFLGFQVFPWPIMRIFDGGNEGYFAEFAVRYLRIYLMIIFALGIQPLSENYFTATGRARTALVLTTMSRQGFLVLPLVVILPMFFGINGILYTGPIVDALACALSLFMIVWDFGQNNVKKISEDKMEKHIGGLMKFCSHCGAEIADEAVICVKCGCSTGNQMGGVNPNDAPSGGFAVLGFLFPVVGLILFIVWNNSSPKKAKSCGKGALIGVIVEVVVAIVATCVSVAVLGAYF
jgi:hypothetical protein